MHRRLLMGPGPERGGGGDSDDILPTGAIVGIVIGAVLFVVFFAVLAFYCVRSRRRSLAQHQVETQESVPNTVYSSKMGRVGRVVQGRPTDSDYLPPTEPPAVYKENSLERGYQIV